MQRSATRLVLAATLLFAAACDPRTFPKDLPPSDELGSPRGYQIARSIIHLHSPFSHDACDNNGLPGGVVNESCYQDLRYAMCELHIDFANLTDHPAHMDEFEFPDLLLPRGGDVIEDGPFGPVANHVSCDNGAAPILTVGFEDELMPYGMERHLAPDQPTRDQLYNDSSPATVSLLQGTAQAVAGIAHTESKPTDYLLGLGMDSIEIYNIHANLDPDIRQEFLGLPPLDGGLALLPYILNPTSVPVPDLSFLSYFVLSPIYFEKWNTLTAAGLHVTGTAGSDSHQNVLALTAPDGERMDQHRRLLKWISNHLLVSERSLDAEKDAARNERNFVVVEGLGSPVGYDFYATAGGNTVGMGDTGAFVPGDTTIHVPLPTLHPSAPGGGPADLVTIKLKRVLPGGLDELVATSDDAPLDFAATEPGAYRAEIWMVPNHLLPHLGPTPDAYLVPTPWILTNHLYLQ
ncbi:MAG: hypothetical protein U0610_06855 [bacterium]